MAKFLTELAEIRARYSRRRVSDYGYWQKQFDQHSLREREFRFASILNNKIENFDNISVLEVGAGNGRNLQFFHRMGVPWYNITANELLVERVANLKQLLPDLRIIPGDAMDSDPANGKFDVILLSAVFTSILDEDFRFALASHTLNLLTATGFILWYDFCYNNPWNPDVRRVRLTELGSLFPSTIIEYSSVTLAPPLGRFVGPLYPLVNKIPWLRTHIVACISPCGAEHAPAIFRSSRRGS